METREIVFSILEREVSIPDNFSITNTLQEFKETYQSISDSVKDAFFEVKHYSGPATLKVVPAICLLENHESIFVPGESDSIATLAALHDVMRKAKAILNESGYADIVIPFASKEKLFGQYFYLMLSHHKVKELDSSEEEPVYKDCGWRLGITFDWTTKAKIDKTGIAYLDLPY